MKYRPYTDFNLNWQRDPAAYKTGGWLDNTDFANSLQQSFEGLNTSTKDMMYFPNTGTNTFRGLDNQHPVLIRDSKGKQQVLYNNQDTAQFDGPVFEQKMQQGGNPPEVSSYGNPNGVSGGGKGGVPRHGPALSPDWLAYKALHNRPKPKYTQLPQSQPSQLPTDISQQQMQERQPIDIRPEVWSSPVTNYNGQGFRPAGFYHMDEYQNGGMMQKSKLDQQREWQSQFNGSGKVWRDGGWLERYQQGGTSGREVQTKNYIPQLPPIDPAFIRYANEPQTQMQDYDKVKEQAQQMPWRDKVRSGLQYAQNTLSKASPLGDLESIPVSVANSIVGSALNLSDPKSYNQYANADQPWYDRAINMAIPMAADMAPFLPYGKGAKPIGESSWKTPPPSEPQYGNWSGTPRSNVPAPLRPEMEPTITTPNPDDWPIINKGTELDNHGYPVNEQPQGTTRMVKSLMKGNPLEKQLSKTGTISTTNIKNYINGNNIGEADKYIVNKVLDEQFANTPTVNYQTLKSAVDKEIVPFNISTTSKYADHGVDKLVTTKANTEKLEANAWELSEQQRHLDFHSNAQPIKTERGYHAGEYYIGDVEGKRYTYDPGNYYSSKEEAQEAINKNVRNAQENVNILSTRANNLNLNGTIKENKTLLFNNSDQLGPGDSKHFESAPYGHARYLVTNEEPNVFHSIENQSDFYQDHDTNLKPLTSNPEKIERRTQSLQTSLHNMQDVYNNMKAANETGGLDGYGFPVHPWQVKDAENLVNSARRSLEAHIMRFKNIPQKQFLEKNHQQRFLQETVDYAAKNGQTQVRVPDRETLSKIEGYPKTDAGTYRPEHETILKKYQGMPNLIKKTFNTEVTPFIDKNGNGWHQFDIPEDYLNNRAEIKAFKYGGKLVQPAGFYKTDLPQEQQGGQQEESPTDWLSQGIQQPSLPNPNRKAYHGRQRSKVDRSLYEPHPAIGHYQDGGDYNPFQKNIDALNNINLDHVKEVKNQQVIKQSPFKDMTPQEKYQHDQERSYKMQDAGLDDNGNPLPLTALAKNKNWQGLANNIVEPMSEMAGYEGLADAAKKGVGTFLQYYTDKKLAEKALPEIAEQQVSNNFPASYIRKNPTGATGNPTITSSPELNKEQQILQSFGLDPNIKKNSDAFYKKQSIINIDKDISNYNPTIKEESPYSDIKSGISPEKDYLRARNIEMDYPGSMKINPDIDPYLSKEDNLFQNQLKDYQKTSIDEIQKRLQDKQRRDQLNMFVTPNPLGNGEAFEQGYYDHYISPNDESIDKYNANHPKNYRNLSTDARMPYDKSEDIKNLKTYFPEQYTDFGIKTPYQKIYEGRQEMPDRYMPSKRQQNKLGGQVKPNKFKSGGWLDSI